MHDQSKVSADCKRVIKKSDATIQESRASIKRAKAAVTKSRNAIEASEGRLSRLPTELLTRDDH